MTRLWINIYTLDAFDSFEFLDKTYLSDKCDPFYNND